uniref:ATP synthase F0 subunit 8 n=1 Tax=Leucauge wulingensis TaxID=2918496 RepID=UPI001FA7D627|nr:ATP synthase F0 subunit 8 [Leucauge wulingensis]ULD67694.1 ATP synthase F0 subunit 8 [Leucauge wulingensis]
MPQLMPLPWMISFLMIIFFVFMVSIIYSHYFLKSGFQFKLKPKFSILWLW